ncbi:Uncharacterised protein [Enterobacter cancerogenus]|uniref:Uncharacterized protein n=1 Tax=Enterobacter cancerogenus TaxID=69218 RepID=A0A484XQF6_9ENTR|nr:Uncharacterised protein [Enterobacter cancerogenus]
MRGKSAIPVNCLKIVSTLDQEDLPSRLPVFELECDQLESYWQEITQLKMSSSLPH